jgi:HlyD family secretion protein
MTRIVTIAAAVSLLAVGGFYYTMHLGAEPPGKFRTAEVKRGDLLHVITATGTMEPEEVVDVGAQVTGIIASLGTDKARSTPGDVKTIDYGSVVEKDTELARVDPLVFDAQVWQAKATLQRAMADLEQMKAKLFQAERNLVRSEELRKKGAVAEADYDQAVADQRTAKANVGVDEASIEQSKAALKLAEVTLGYTVIKSPVRGTIVARRVNVGQTVVSNLSASSLFLIAKDLRRIQVWASVNEADMGQIRPGVPASFTVDTYPNEIFRGKVVQVRLNATMTQNVVTYTVVVETDNADLRLLPYLTANLKFEIEQYRDVLKVPNAALRWKPRLTRIAPSLREEYRAISAEKPEGEEAAGRAESKPSGAPSGSPGEAKAAAEAKPVEGKPAKGEKSAAATAPAGAPPAGGQRPKSKSRDDRGRLWVKDGDYVRWVDVKIGATDGVMTVVRGKDVTDKTEIVIGEVVVPAADDAKNPFAPTIFKKAATPKKEGS